MVSMLPLLSAVVLSLFLGRGLGATYKCGKASGPGFQLTPLLDSATGQVKSCCYSCGKDEKRPGSDKCESLGAAVPPVEGSCIQRPIGNKCFDDLQCSNGGCIDNVCRAVSGIGPCKADTDCYPLNKNQSCYQGQCGIKVGKACTLPRDYCTKGNFCHYTNPTMKAGICRPQNKLGDDCLTPLDTLLCRSELFKTKCENKKCVLDHRAVCYGSGQCGKGLTCEQSVTCDTINNALEAAGRKWLPDHFPIGFCLSPPFEENRDRKFGVCVLKSDKGVVTPGAQCVVKNEA